MVHSECGTRYGGTLKKPDSEFIDTCGSVQVAPMMQPSERQDVTALLGKDAWHVFRI
jgi:hypothetical protein